MHDFVIVGAGTAGCVLAHELAASGRHAVALVEAGGAPASPFVKIPAGFAKLFKSRLDWNFHAAPDARSGRSIYIPRGRMLGGSSNMNAQIHQWGHPADFDAWRDAGAAGWAWADVAPVLRAQEALAAPQPGRGATGPMHAIENPVAHPLSRAFVDAYRAIGRPQTCAYNGGAFDGAWIAEIAHHKGERFSAYDAYLKPVTKRANLRILSDATALRITFEGKRAAGVIVARGGVETVVHARRGVIVCAGAFGSPQLLMCSGVGPHAALQRIGAPVVCDLPGVGANLHDHPMVVPVFRTSRRDTLKAAESPANLLRYLLMKSGPLSSNGVEAIAFTSTTGAAAPDIEFLFAPFEWRNEGLDAPQVHAFSIGVAAVAPKSRGSVTLDSADARRAPRIDLGLLSDSEGVDRRSLLDGLALARRVAGQAPLSASMTTEDDPGGAVTGDAALSAWIDQRIQTVYHPAGTCRMGADDHAVTDARLAVRGVEGLWIADASVMPAPVRGHPNAAVAMIAKRAAGFVSPG